MDVGGLEGVPGDGTLLNCSDPKWGLRVGEGFSGPVYNTDSVSCATGDRSLY